MHKFQTQGIIFSLMHMIHLPQLPEYFGELGNKEKHHIIKIYKIPLILQWLIHETVIRHYCNQALLESGITVIHISLCFNENLNNTSITHGNNLIVVYCYLNTDKLSSTLSGTRYYLTNLLDLHYFVLTKYPKPVV